MNKQKYQLIVDEVISQLGKMSNLEQEVPIGVSVRHCHLNREDLETLFGKGYRLSKKSNLSQPENFAANETVTIAGPKGSLEKVRVLGPLRNLTQVEVSYTDSFKLGLQPPIRLSGNINGSSPVTIVGPYGSIYLNEGLIIAQAHIHMSSNDACNFELQNGENVTVLVNNYLRPIRFEKVRIRVSPEYKLEMHIDTDEANAGAIKTGDKGRILKAGKKE